MNERFVGAAARDAAAASSPAAAAAQALASVLDRTDPAPPLGPAPAWLVAITGPDGVLALRTHGEPRRDGAPTTPGTVFRIASMTKSFLSAAILSLRDEGLLDLHAPVTRWIPELASVSWRGAPVEITCSQLLSNRAGLPEDNGWGDEHLGSSREEMMAHVADGLVLSAEPGTLYQYSNLGQSLVARVAERITGRAIEEIITERFLLPLGLDSTRFAARDYPEGTDLAAGFRTFDDGANYVPEPYVASLTAQSGALACIGALFSTAADIATWMSFFASAWSDEPVRPDVLAPASRREMQSARTPMSASAPWFGGRELDGAGYGYGLNVELDRRFGLVAQHSGGLPGFSSHMRWHAATGFGTLAFGNSDAFSGSRVAGEVLAAFLEEIAAPSDVVEPWPATIAAAEAIDAMLRSTQDVDSLAPLFARNLLRDVPAAIRSARLAVLQEGIGRVLAAPAPLRERIVSSPDASSLRWALPCDAGTLICDVHLVGLASPLVQNLDIAISGPDGRKPLRETPRSTDHTLVRWPE